MEKINSDELFRRLFQNCLYIQHYNKDCMYDFHAIREHELKDENKFNLNIVIFYRSTGTWMAWMDNPERTPLDQGIQSMFANSDFAAVIKQTEEYEYEYERVSRSAFPYRFKQYYNK